VEVVAVVAVDQLDHRDSPAAMDKMEAMVHRDKMEVQEVMQHKVKHTNKIGALIVHRRKQDRRDFQASPDNADRMVHPEMMVPMEMRVPMATQDQPAPPVSLEVLVNRAVRVNPVKSLIKAHHKALPVHPAHREHLEATDSRAETVIQEVLVNKDNKAMMVLRDVQETTDSPAALVGMVAEVVTVVAIIVLHRVQHPDTVCNRRQCQQHWRMHK